MSASHARSASTASSPFLLQNPSGRPRSRTSGASLRPPRIRVVARAIGFAACALALLLCAQQARAGDPYLRWHTIHTPHFRIHYHAGLGHIAQRTAALAEAIRARLVPRLGYRPKEVTEIVLSDTSDSANGSAAVQPYDIIRLFVNAPDDMSVLGDYDDWMTTLLTHEDTHIVHIDNVSGIPAMLNAVLGKTYSPNQLQPRWILEGLATAMESRLTSGGRLRSTQFDMYLRADVLEGNFADLDQISNSVRRWPSGNLWYLYGSHFVDWILHLYGPQTFATVATDYGNNIIPYGINRSIRRATGLTYTQLYPAWHAHLMRKYTAQRQSVLARGLRTGTRLTHRGRVASYPRFIPRCARSNDDAELVYYRDDGHTTAGFYRLSVNQPEDAKLWMRSRGDVATFGPDCGLIFESVAPTRRRYRFSDLFRLPPQVSGAPRGLDRRLERLTIGRRAREPDVSPNGREIVFVTNRAGTTTLRLAHLTPSGEIEGIRVLLPSKQGEQVFTPRFSPDGKRIAFSRWSHGGYRDIHILELDSGRVHRLMHDRALDQQPTWSSDGQRLYFASDRTGISNIYAHDLTSGRTRQITNVVTGAYMPAASDDEKQLVYVGYTHEGFDLFAMKLDESEWLPAITVMEPRPSPLTEPPIADYPATDYNPLPTLRPRSYELEYGPSAFGNALFVSTSGSDAVGHHSFTLSLRAEAERAEPSGSLSYAYRRLPFTFNMSAFRQAAPRRDFRIGDEAPTLVETQTGVSSSVSLGLPSLFESQSISLGYSIARFHQELPLGPSLDPNEPIPIEPHRGYLGTVRLRYSYSNAESYTWSISREKGFALSLALDYASEHTASEETLTAITAHSRGYVPMPWAAHHVLALAASGGASTGTYPRRGLFFTGGFADSELIEDFRSGNRQGGFVLRGYEARQFIGRHFNLFNAEYRFPIAYPEWGIATLPAFWRSVSGTLFADYGGAFNRLDLNDPFDQYHLGLGGELRFELIMGYFVNGTIRLGLAHGLDSEAPGLQTYFVVASSF